MKFKLLQQLIHMSKYALYGMVLQCFFFSVLLANKGNAQKYKSIREVYVTINFQDDDLLEAFEKIEALTNLRFAYNKSDIRKDIRFNRDYDSQSLYDILINMSQTSRLMFQQVNDVINVSSFNSDANKDKERVEINIQATTVSGMVTDGESNEPLPGVAILVKGTSNGTTTDVNGRYSIKVPENATTLIYSFIGYMAQEVDIAGRSTIDIALKPDVQALDEVVVLGFGQTQKKVAQTGSVASISTKEIKQSPVANITNALAGRLPGLIAVQRSGEPGADQSDLYIRGRATFNSSAPLVTIDGVQKESNAISLLDPNEVESITILKDASATALYGVKGANGVIIVKTKRGESGKPKISVSVQRSIQSATRVPEYLNSYNYATLANEAYLNDNPNGTLIPYSEDELEAYRTGSDPYKYPDVDWLGEMLQPSNMTRANFNVSGGNEVVKYFLNIGYTDQDGIYKAEENDKYDPHLKYRRYNFRSNTDIKFNDKFNIALNLFGSIENKNSPYTSTYDLFNYLLKTPPNKFPIKYPTGFYGGGFRSNPFHLLNTTGFTQSFNSSLSGMLSATRKLDFITDGLFVKGNYSFDGYFTNNFVRQRFERTALYNGVGDINDPANYTYDGNDTPLQAPNSYYGQTRNIWMDVSLNYEKTFGNHMVTGLLLANRTQRVLGGQIPYVSQGLVSRITYSNQNKYFAELNAGYNGTDNFAKGRRYGFFPAASVGWIISEEGFLKNSSFIDFLKVRASYGLTGNDQLSGRRWLFVSEYETGTGYWYGDPLQPINGVQEGPMANPYVTWETAKKTNIGIEMSFLNDLIDVNIDLFQENRNDILITRGTVPAIIGVSSGRLPPANLGEVVNKGFEVEVAHQNKIGALNYYIRGNASYAKNNVEYMDEVDRSYGYLQRTGQSIGQIYGLTAIGFFESEQDIANSPKQFGEVIPGDLKYKDLNGDGVIDANDEGPIGRSTVPEILFGLSGGMEYSNFDFSFLFQGAANYNVMFSHEAAWEFYNGASVMNHHLGRWTPETAASATYPVLHYGQNSNNHRTSSFFMKDATYLRLKNIELGYTFKNLSLIDKMGLTNVRVFANGMNLLTWDRMGEQSFDPEAPSGRGFSYPQQKVFNFGLTVDF